MIYIMIIMIYDDLYHDPDYHEMSWHIVKAYAPAAACRVGLLYLTLPLRYGLQPVCVHAKM